MKDNKLTPEEIKKALECCKPDNDESCLNCPFDKYPLPVCAEMLSKESVDLLNRQQSAIDVYMQENDRLKTAYIQVSEDRNEIRKEAEAEIEEWKKINRQLYDEMEERRKEDIGIAKGYARIEAIKEFAERLKEIYRNIPTLWGTVAVKHIDNLVKEMVGEDK